MKFLLFFSLFSLSFFSNAENLKNKKFGHVIISEVTSIYDGDTFRANIAEWPEIVGHRIGIRIGGIDTPEIRGKCQTEKEKARLAKQFTVQNLRKAKKIELRNMKRGKYFRIVADVWLDGKNLADALLKAGHAVKYDGGTKINWCEKRSATSDGLYGLTVNTIPVDSMIKIMNIVPKYKPGIKLKPGKYDVLVKRKYKTWRKWVEIIDSDLSINVVLEKPESSYQKAAKPESSTPKFSCAKKRCADMTSCKEAYYKLNTCGYKRLDRDKDGVPCEKICSAG